MSIIITLLLLVLSRMFRHNEIQYIDVEVKSEVTKFQINSLHALLIITQVSTNADIKNG